MCYCFCSLPNYLPLTTYLLLPTSYYLPLTTYCLLLTTYYLLLTTYLASLVKSWFLEFDRRHLSRYESAALIPAIRTGCKVGHSKTAPLFSISIIPASNEVRNAITKPWRRSLVSIVKNFDFIIVIY
jgi:hypothetical protein